MLPSATAVTVPCDTVAICVLLELQVATVVMSKEPLHVVASAVNAVVLPAPMMLPLDGFIVIDWMQPNVTVSACVPLIDGSCVDEAVIVPVPYAAAVTNPAPVIVAMF